MLFALLEARFQTEIAKGNLDELRVDRLERIMAKIKAILENTDDSLAAHANRFSQLKILMRESEDILKEPSYGLPLPAKDTRAYGLIKIWLEIKSAIFRERNANTTMGKSERAALDALFLEVGQKIKKLYEAGNDENAVLAIEDELLRPLHLRFRHLMGRNQTMFVNPIWSTKSQTILPNAVFYAGEKNDLFEQINTICQEQGLHIQATPAGINYGKSRWNDLFTSSLTIFDFTIEDTIKKAAIAYELGMARTLGKPIIILASRSIYLPFDIDIEPIYIADILANQSLLETTINQTLYGVPDYLKGEKTISKTVHYLKDLYQQETDNLYVNQSIKLLNQQLEKPDPIDLQTGHVIVD